MKLSNRMIALGRALTVTMLSVIAFSHYAVAAAEMSDEKLKAVASAYIKVFEVQQTYAPRIETAETPEEANRLQQAANQEMMDVIENEENVTVEDYNDVITALRDDEELRDRLQAQVDAILEEEPE